MLGISAAMPFGATLAFGQKAAGSSAVSPGDVLSRLTQADFTRYLRTNFNIRMSARIVWKMELYQVLENKAGTTQGLQNFSLFFRGSHDNPLRPNSYSFEHPQLGNFLLFISHAGSSGGLKQYEAVFNRL
jgi:Domain of unknown function (DUF6916)